MDRMPPLTVEDLKVAYALNAPHKQTLQLQVDAINVLENRVDMDTFPPEYQKLIKNYYRFTPAIGGMAAKIAMASAGRQGKG